MFTKGFAASGNTTESPPITLPADVVLYVPFNDAGDNPNNSVVYQSDKGSTATTTISNYWFRAVGDSGYPSTASTAPQIIDTPGTNPMGYTRCFNGGNTNGGIYGTDTSWYNGNIHEGDFNTLSVEFWFYLSTNSNLGGSYDRIFEWGDYYAHRYASNFDEMGFGVEFRSSYDNRLGVFAYSEGTSSNRYGDSSTNNISTNAWHHLYMQVDVVNNRFCFAIQQSSSSSTQISGYTGLSTTLDNLTWTPKNYRPRFGSVNSSTGYLGGINEFIIRVNDPDAATKYASSFAPPTTPLIS